MRGDCLARVAYRCSSRLGRLFLILILILILILFLILTLFLILILFFNDRHDRSARRIGAVTSSLHEKRYAPNKASKANCEV